MDLQELISSIENPHELYLVNELKREGSSRDYDDDLSSSTKSSHWRDMYQSTQDILRSGRIESRPSKAKIVVPDTQIAIPKMINAKFLRSAPPSLGKLMKVQQQDGGGNTSSLGFQKTRYDDSSSAGGSGNGNDSVSSAMSSSMPMSVSSSLYQPSQSFCLVDISGSASTSGSGSGSHAEKLIAHNLATPTKVQTSLQKLGQTSIGPNPPYILRFKKKVKMPCQQFRDAMKKDKLLSDDEVIALQRRYSSPNRRNVLLYAFLADFKVAKREAILVKQRVIRWNLVKAQTQGAREYRATLNEEVLLQDSGTNLPSPSLPQSFDWRDPMLETLCLHPLVLLQSLQLFIQK